MRFTCNCPLTLDGDTCLNADSNHLEHHQGAPGVQCTDKQQDAAAQAA